MTDVSSHDSCSHLYQSRLNSCKMHPGCGITDWTAYNLEFGNRKDHHLSSSSSCELLLNDSSSFEDGLVACKNFDGLVMVSCDRYPSR